MYLPGGLEENCNKPHPDLQITKRVATVPNDTFCLSGFDVFCVYIGYCPDQLSRLTTLVYSSLRDTRCSTLSHLLESCSIAMLYECLSEMACLHFGNKSVERLLSQSGLP